MYLFSYKSLVIFHLLYCFFLPSFFFFPESLMLIHDLLFFGATGAGLEVLMAAAPFIDTVLLSVRVRGESFELDMEPE